MFKFIGFCLMSIALVAAKPGIDSSLGYAGFPAAFSPAPYPSPYIPNHHAASIVAGYSPQIISPYSTVYNGHNIPAAYHHPSVYAIPIAAYRSIQVGAAYHQSAPIPAHYQPNPFTTATYNHGHVLGASVPQKYFL